jgi:hypothetical protein
VSYRPAPVPPDAAPAPAIDARLGPDAIGMAQDTAIRTASSAPAETMAILGSAFVQPPPEST